ncbi:diadenosine tetraphosphate hydrolase [Dermatophilus congolensis]|nr:diadenosine tetraphosphate hydrolase [Dermatophilus congolensis]
MRRLPTGFAVIGDAQHFPGYCVLITDDPQATSITDLLVSKQEAFLADAALLARAVEKVMRGRDPQFRRINIEIQGNTDAFLHAHVTPRFDWEPQPCVRWPAALTWWEGIPDIETCGLGPQHNDLRSEIESAIDEECARRR